jgi:hypothetical protein
VANFLSVSYPTSQFHYLSLEAAWECPDIDLLFAAYQFHELISSLKRSFNSKRVGIEIAFFVFGIKGIGKAVFLAPVNYDLCDLIA